MQSAVADRHNFGQQVKPTDGALFLGAPRYFQKPRTVFWEWLFFGASSPLHSLFAVRGKNTGLVVSDAVFNLDVSIETSWSGKSCEIITSAVDSDTNLDLFARFGMLLGYAYVFGIRDLHHANLIRTETNIQVIDAEVVLTDLVLPHETLLLPFKDVEWKQCGLSLLAPNKESITEMQKHAMLSGYVDMLSVIDQRRNDISEAINAQDLVHPVRIILRNTKEYSAFLETGDARDALLYDALLYGERVQLERNDVPYFFKRLGSNEVHWVMSVSAGGSHEFASLESDSIYAADIARHAMSPAQLLTSGISDEDRIATRLLRGMAYLRKHIGGQGQFQWRSKSLSVTPDSISFLS